MISTLQELRHRPWKGPSTSREGEDNKARHRTGGRDGSDLPPLPLRKELITLFYFVLFTGGLPLQYLAFLGCLEAMVKGHVWWPLLIMGVLVIAVMIPVPRKYNDSIAVRKSSFVRAMIDYFDMELMMETKLDPSRKYLIAQYPRECMPSPPQAIPIICLAIICAGPRLRVAAG
jgi:hypothetical protein